MVNPKSWINGILPAQPPCVTELKKQLPSDLSFGSLAICVAQTHDFASPPRGRFAFSTIIGQHQ
jgi:hypothetical protein